MPVILRRFLEKKRKKRKEIKNIYKKRNENVWVDVMLGSFKNISQHGSEKRKRFFIFQNVVSLDIEMMKVD